MRDLAAEYALGLASGRDAERGAKLLADDKAFRAETAAWIARLSALLDEVAGAQPPASLWARIERELDGSASVAANYNVVALESQMRLWRGVTAMMTALAACFALLLVFRPPEQVPAPTPTAPVRQASEPMVAMVGEDQHDMMIVATWDPAQRQLVLAVAGDMPLSPGKSHQLWVIPPSGPATSLGVMRDEKKMRMDLAQRLADLLSQGATIAVSLEPPGGSPTGKPTGPVMWSGKLQAT